MVTVDGLCAHVRDKARRRRACQCLADLKRTFRNLGHRRDAATAAGGRGAGARAIASHVGPGSATAARRGSACKGTQLLCVLCSGRRQQRPGEDACGHTSTTTRPTTSQWQDHHCRRCGATSTGWGGCTICPVGIAVPRECAACVTVSTRVYVCGCVGGGAKQGGACQANLVKHRACHPQTARTPPTHACAHTRVCTTFGHGCSRGSRGAPTHCTSKTRAAPPPKNKRGDSFQRPSSRRENGHIKRNDSAFRVPSPAPHMNRRSEQGRCGSVVAAVLRTVPVPGQVLHSALLQANTQSTESRMSWACGRTFTMSRCQAGTCTRRVR